MKNYLNKSYPTGKVKYCKDNFILCEGDIPIMFVAHMDTVFKTPPKNIYYDAEQQTMWSPDGLGADDRAGVFLIWKMVHDGHRPHICLTTDEEVGGIGAKMLISYYANCPFDCKYIVQLDRQGTNDCVFYGCANEEFQEYIEAYNFITEWGTFSDISTICPAWKIAGVNLSVGYKNEHTVAETLNFKALYNTYVEVCNMMKNIENAPHFEYVFDPYDRFYSAIGQKYFGSIYPIDYYDDDYMPASIAKTTQQVSCYKCKKMFDVDELFSVKTNKEPFLHRLYCIDCVRTGVNWCEICHEPFEMSNENDILCPDCKKKVKI
jgi:hypothetical protein